MKVLGLLGGMSWESTVGYYRLANEEVRARLGGLHSAPLLLWSVDFAEIETLRAALVEMIDSLAAQGAEGVVLGCTEIELLVRPEDTTVPVFATTALHVRSAVDAALR